MYRLLLVWSNVFRKDCQLLLPETLKFPSLQKADVFHPREVPEVAHKLLDLLAGQVRFQNASFVSKVNALMTTCGSSDFSKLDA